MTAIREPIRAGFGALRENPLPRSRTWPVTPASCSCPARQALLVFKLVLGAITSVGSLLGILIGVFGAGGIAAVVRRFTDAPIEALRSDESPPRTRRPFPGSPRDFNVWL